MAHPDRTAGLGVEFAGRPQTGVYTGASTEGALSTYREFIPLWHKRRVGEYNSTWFEAFQLAPFDILLAQQIENAKRKGKNVVNVVDLGAGEHNFARSFLTNPAHGEQSRRLLRGNPDMRLRLVSLTDATTPDEFLRPEPLEPFHEVDHDNSQISAEAIPYSVTSTQPLRKFYEAVGIEESDLVVSVGMLAYLQPQVFQDVLVDVTNNLSEGGGAVLIDYKTWGAGKLCADGNKKGEDRPVTLRDMRTDFQATITTQEIREEAARLMEDPDANGREIMSLVQTITNGLMLANAFPFDPLSPPDGPAARSKPEVWLDYFMNKVIPIGEEMISAVAVGEEKEAILKDLKTKFQKEAKIVYNTNGILIAKS